MKMHPVHHKIHGSAQVAAPVTASAQGTICGTCKGKGCGLCGGKGLLSGLRHGAGNGVCGGCGGRGCGLCGGGLGLGQACHGCGGRGCGLCHGSGKSGGACGFCGGKGCRFCSGIHSMLARMNPIARHHNKVKYFVGPGGPVPLTPGYVPYVVTTRSPRDFLAFPPFSDIDP